MNARERLREAVKAWRAAIAWPGDHSRAVVDAAEAVLAETPAAGTWAEVVTHRLTCPACRATFKLERVE